MFAVSQADGTSAEGVRQTEWNCRRHSQSRAGRGHQ